MRFSIFSAITTLLAVTSASPTARATKDFQSEMLASHNYFRSQHGATPLTWDNTLAQLSQAWANTCIFAHDSGGEDLAYRTKFKYWGEFVNMWGSERTQYNYSQPKFSEVTGHFTQVVWKNSKTVGCAWKDCGTIGGIGKALGYYVVCKYSSPGNYKGQYADQVGRQTKGNPSDVYT
ncbi:hypothetical protein E4U57_001603 [Claviceps arundinis]|uniref:SCP domain-containing protein n=1 Tax=Claviceps arundinis TaxID=1623583 RepID=A0A9P7SQ46_9HYPO|nr:hypothetical protein E4U56_001581 [Claviceps arundinis]KAG5966900.1 hypothetical protein E4U57_001603 [Claviceps arundinis]